MGTIPHYKAHNPLPTVLFICTEDSQRLDSFVGGGVEAGTQSLTHVSPCSLALSQLPAQNWTIFPVASSHAPRKQKKALATYLMNEE